MDALTKKKRDDDDDEIMPFLLPALHLFGSTWEPRKKIPRHISRLSGKECLEEVLNGHVKDCCVAFRMEPNMFRAIVAYLRDEHLLRDTRGVRVEEQFAFFMYMLSHNASYEDIQYEFKHSGETIHRHIKSIFNIIQTLALDRSRAHWNLGLEKALVELLHDHNSDCYRGQNGWSTDAWNRIVKLFHEKFKHVSFSRQQIQDKEKELKREYRMLKEARKQSGASWDDKLCMIVADEPVWENIITSYPKASKFKSKSFPLFETLGELYDGHTAEGSLNLTSLPDPTPSEPSITQISVGDGLEAEEFESPQMPLNVEDEYDDDDLRILEHPNAARAREATAEVQRKQKESTVPDGRKKSLKKQKKEDLSYFNELTRKFFALNQYAGIRELKDNTKLTVRAKQSLGDLTYSLLDRM